MYAVEQSNERLPPWAARRSGRLGQAAGLRRLLRQMRLHTVCESARCPNIGECFSRPALTFMILGTSCTRRCAFCAVDTGRPLPPDPGEPLRVAEAARRLGLRHVVVTSVTRDDLPDGGAGHFAATIEAVRSLVPAAGIEVLVPDFGGGAGPVATVLGAGPDVFGHNVESVPRISARIRPYADYGRSLQLLALAKELRSEVLTKSGLMLGLGETWAEVMATLADLRGADCDLITLGQYLRPTREHEPVAEYIHPDAFADYARAARQLGFREVAAGPFVRSSYHAEEMTRAPARPMRGL